MATFLLLINPKSTGLFAPSTARGGGGGALSQVVNFENLLFGPNSIFNIRKSHKISGGKALYFRSYQQETLPEGGHPPEPLGLNVHTFFDFSWHMVQSSISLFQAISSPHQVIFKHYRLNQMTRGKDLPYSCVSFYTVCPNKLVISKLVT